MMTNAQLETIARTLAMRAGSWFDRKDLTLQQREQAVAEIILEELNRAAGKLNQDLPAASK